MVLQSDMKIPIWGTCKTDGLITIQFEKQKVTVMSSDGKWKVWLKPLSVNSKPQKMTITGESTIVINNILIGEVWFCSGQSNMEMPVGKYEVYRGTENFEDVLRNANKPSIRFLQVPHTNSALPLQQLNIGWRLCDSLTAYWSSAVAYFFADKLHRTTNVPVGIIISAWGGSAIQPWTPIAAFKINNVFKKETLLIDSINNLYETSAHISQHDWQQQITSLMDTLQAIPPSVKWLAKPTIQPASGNKLLYPLPASLFNGMVAPIVPYAIHGVLWYQGESNLGDGDFYTQRMAALIESWRNEWGQGNFPFYFVQIADFNYKDWPVKNATPDLLPRLWAAQKAVLTIPNTAMIATEGLGEAEDIHPRKKKEIGERLADTVINNFFMNNKLFKK